MELARAILLNLEDRKLDSSRKDDFGYERESAAADLGVDVDVLNYHLVLLFEAQLIDGWALRGLTHRPGRRYALTATTYST
jgi:hypothetical protein